MSNEIILKSRSPAYEIPVMSVGSYMMKKLEMFQEKTCVIESKTGKELTVKQIITEANSLAVALLRRGVTKTDIFQCFSANNLQYAITQFAFYFLGNTFTPTNPTNGIFELKNQIKNSGSTILFTSVSNANIVNKVINDQNNEDIRKQIKLVVVFDGTYDNFLPFSQLISEGKDEKLERIPYFEVKPKKDIFTIVFTSGTTGLPKGAMYTHYSFVAALEGYKSIFCIDFGSDLIVAGIYPFGHAGGNLTFPAWVKGGNTVVIYEGMNEELILQSVEKYKINLLPIYPSLGHRFIDGDLKDKYDLSSVEFIVTGGSKFPTNVAQRIIEKYNIIFREIYGSTEYMGPLKNTFEDLGCVGAAEGNTQIKVIDLQTGNSLGPNMDGEICLRGPKLFVGYFNNESATKASIDSNGWYHTGDVGHYDENEKFYITDRLKELIKFKAWSVAPAEIESLLMTHKSVAAVVVVGVKHQTDGQHPRAYIKLKSGSKVTEEELIQYVEENMAFQKRLRAGVRFVDEIPLSVVGKADRQYFKNIISNEVISSPLVQN